MNIFHFPDIDDLFDVQSELLDVESKWKSIGKALRLKPSVLESIEADCRDVKSSMDKVLTKWLNQSYNVSRFGPPSWKLLVAAVAHPNGGDNRALAERIAQKYNGKYDGNSDCMFTVNLDLIQSVTPSSYHLPPSFPPLQCLRREYHISRPITLLPSPHSVSSLLLFTSSRLFSLEWPLILDTPLITIVTTICSH